MLPTPVRPPPHLPFAVRLCRAREGPARPLPPARSDGWLAGQRGDEAPERGKMESWVPCRAARERTGRMSGLHCQAAGSGPSSRFRAMTALSSCWRMPLGWPGCSPPAGAAGLAWAPAGPAEAWSALQACTSRMRAGSPMSRQETEGRVVRLVPHSIGHERA
jgi:hypothetical protein